MHPIGSIAAPLPIAMPSAAPVSAPQAGQGVSFHDLLRAALDRAGAENAASTPGQAIAPQMFSQAAERAALAFREITHVIH